METVLTNAYTHLDQKSKLFETNSIANGTKELLQRKIYVRETSFFFTKWHFEKFINIMEVTKGFRVFGLSGHQPSRPALGPHKILTSLNLI